MEFPDLGKHCSEQNCKQLDFLPVKCDSCSKIFCNEHFQYEKHHCPEAYRKDNQVPVCPLCNTPVSVRKGLSPDIVIGQHIDNDCQKKKMNSNKCNVKGCKVKELIPVVCDKCHKNFCLRHRLEEDHSCEGFEGSGRGMSSAGAAAMSRAPAKPAATNGIFKSHNPQKTALSSVGRDLDRERRERQGQRPGGQRSQGPGSSIQTYQAGMSEDEALAQAMAMSLAQSQPGGAPETSPSDAAKRTQEEADRALALALQQGEEEARRGRNNTAPRPPNRQSSSDKSSCRLS